MKKNSLPISKLTLGFGFFVVISASFTQEILFYFFRTFGKMQTARGLGSIFVILGIGVVTYISGQPIKWPKKFSFFLLFVLGLILSWRIPILAERIHILEYGLLGWLLMKDTAKISLSAKAILISLLIVFCFGALDEGFQYILPQRVAELRDILLNVLGGSWGIALFVLKRRQAIFPCAEKAFSASSKN